MKLSYWESGLSRAAVHIYAGAMPMRRCAPAPISADMLGVGELRVNCRVFAVKVRNGLGVS